MKNFLLCLACLSFTLAACSKPGAKDSSEGVDTRLNTKDDFDDNTYVDGEDPDTTSTPEPSTPVPTSPAPTAELYLVNGAGKCLAQENGNAVVRDCSNSTNHKWQLTTGGRIRNSAQKCLLLQSNALKVSDCPENETDSWSFTSISLLLNKGGKCLHSTLPTSGNGALSVDTCKNVAAQKWQLLKNIPQASCKITVKSCPQHPSFQNTFVDTQAAANLNPNTCAKRAQEYYSWCGTPQPVQASFHVAGLPIATTSSTTTPADKGPSTNFAGNCTESIIRAHLDAGRSVKCTNASSQVVTIKNLIKISKDNVTLEGSKGLRLQWTGAGTCSQAEGQSAMLEIYGNRVTLKNFEVIGAPDGLHVILGDGNKLENIVFKKVCEDAITIGGYQGGVSNALINNCRIENADDKAIQVNSGSVIIQNTTFKNVGKAVATGYGSGPTATSKNIYFYSNNVENCGNSGARVSGYGKGQTKFFATGNTFKNCKVGIITNNEARTESKSNKFRNKCSRAFEAADSAQVYSRGDAIDCDKDDERTGRAKVRYE